MVGLLWSRFILNSLGIRQQVLGLKSGRSFMQMRIADGRSQDYKRLN